jgi:hypothetical protein
VRRPIADPVPAAERITDAFMDTSRGANSLVAAPSRPDSNGRYDFLKDVRMDAPTLVSAGAVRGGGVFARESISLPWVEAGRKGLKLKMVYGEREAGRFLGLVGFDPMVKTGLHQHLGVASSMFLAGSLDDYQGPFRGGFGINLKGATHDAISWEGCVLASRLEAPVIYPEETPAELDLHHGSLRGALVNPRPEDPPDLNIPLSALVAMPTRMPGVTRRMVFDYQGTGTDRRMVMLGFLPGGAVPEFETSDRLDLFVVAGDLTATPASGAPARAEASGFIVVEPGSRVSLRSGYGAQVVAWSEAPVRLRDAPPADPFGF